MKDGNTYLIKKVEGNKVIFYNQWEKKELKATLSDGAIEFLLSIRDDAEIPESVEFSEELIVEILNNEKSKKKGVDKK